MRRAALIAALVAAAADAHGAEDRVRYRSPGNDSDRRATLEQTSETRRNERRLQQGGYGNEVEGWHQYPPVHSPSYPQAVQNRNGPAPPPVYRTQGGYGDEVDGWHQYPPVHSPSYPQAVQNRNRPAPPPVYPAAPLPAPPAYQHHPPLRQYHNAYQHDSPPAPALVGNHMGPQGYPNYVPPPSLPHQQQQQQHQQYPAPPMVGNHMGPQGYPNYVPPPSLPHQQQQQQHQQYPAPPMVGNHMGPQGYPNYVPPPPPHQQQQRQYPAPPMVGNHMGPQGYPNYVPPPPPPHQQQQQQHYPPPLTPPVPAQSWEGGRGEIDGGGGRGTFGYGGDVFSQPHSSPIPQADTYAQVPDHTLYSSYDLCTAKDDSVACMRFHDNGICDLHIVDEDMVGSDAVRACTCCKYDTGLDKVTEVSYDCTNLGQSWGYAGQCRQIPAFGAMPGSQEYRTPRDGSGAEVLSKTSIDVPENCHLEGDMVYCATYLGDGECNLTIGRQLGPRLPTTAISFELGFVPQACSCCEYEEDPPTVVAYDCTNIDEQFGSMGQCHVKRNEVGGTVNNPNMSGIGVEEDVIVGQPIPEASDSSSQSDSQATDGVGVEEDMERRSPHPEDERESLRAIDSGPFRQCYWEKNVEYCATFLGDGRCTLVVASNSDSRDPYFLPQLCSCCEYKKDSLAMEHDYIVVAHDCTNLGEEFGSSGQCGSWRDDNKVEEGSIVGPYGISEDQSADGINARYSPYGISEDQSAVEISARSFVPINTYSAIQVEDEKVYSDIKVEDEKVYSDIKVEDEKVYSDIKVEDEKVYSDIKVEDEKVYSDIKVEDEMVWKREGEDENDPIQVPASKSASSVIVEHRAGGNMSEGGITSNESPTELATPTLRGSFEPSLPPPSAAPTVVEYKEVVGIIGAIEVIEEGGIGQTPPESTDLSWDDVRDFVGENDSQIFSRLKEATPPVASSTISSATSNHGIDIESNLCYLDGDMQICAEFLGDGQCSLTVGVNPNISYHDFTFTPLLCSCCEYQEGPLAIVAHDCTNLGEEFGSSGRCGNEDMETIGMIDSTSGRGGINERVNMMLNHGNQDAKKYVDNLSKKGLSKQVNMVQNNPHWDDVRDFVGENDSQIFSRLKEATPPVASSTISSATSNHGIDIESNLCYLDGDMQICAEFLGDGQCSLTVGVNPNISYHDFTFTPLLCSCCEYQEGPLAIVAHDCTNLGEEFGSSGRCGNEDMETIGMIDSTSGRGGINERVNMILDNRNQDNGPIAAIPQTTTHSGSYAEAVTIARNQGEAEISEKEEKVIGSQNQGDYADNNSKNSRHCYWKGDVQFCATFLENGRCSMAIFVNPNNPASVSPHPDFLPGLCSCCEYQKDTILAYDCNNLGKTFGSMGQCRIEAWETDGIINSPGTDKMVGKDDWIYGNGKEGAIRNSKSTKNSNDGSGRDVEQSVWGGPLAVARSAGGILQIIGFDDDSNKAGVIEREPSLEREPSFSADMVPRSPPREDERESTTTRTSEVFRQCYWERDVMYCATFLGDGECRLAVVSNSNSPDQPSQPQLCSCCEYQEDSLAIMAQDYAIVAHDCTNLGEEFGSSGRCGANHGLLDSFYMSQSDPVDSRNDQVVAEKDDTGGIEEINDGMLDSPIRNDVRALPSPIRDNAMVLPSPIQDNSRAFADINDAQGSRQCFWEGDTHFCATLLGDGECSLHVFADPENPHPYFLPQMCSCCEYDEESITISGHDCTNLREQFGSSGRCGMQVMNGVMSEAIGTDMNQLPKKKFVSAMDSHDGSGLEKDFVVKENIVGGIRVFSHNNGV